MKHSRVQKLNVTQLVTIMEPESSLPCSQDPTTGRCAEQAKSSPQIRTLFKSHFNIILTSKSMSRKWSLPFILFEKNFECIY
jgi:hypothetical protein